MKKVRLDIFLVERGFFNSRETSKRYIMSGYVLVNGEKIIKPSYEVKMDDLVEILDKPKYVSRGGYKIEGAFRDFNLSAEGKICMDVGASTGGFTDFLLNNGAMLVYAVDVGYGQLDYSLRKNPRVVVLEKINARYIDKLVSEGKILLRNDISFVTMDLSFISVTKVILPVSRVVRNEAEFLVLIKPQFELEKKYIGKGGIVVKEEFRKIAIERVNNFLIENNFKVIGTTPSCIKGTDGNQEYFIYFKK